MRVAFLGLGLMGSRMAANLLTKGFELHVYNRTKSRAEPLLAKGAIWEETPRSAAQNSDVVVTCVADFPALKQIFDGADGIAAGLTPGKLFIESSTLAPAQVTELAQRCAERGAGFLAAPMTGSKGGAEAGTLVFMCGGTTEAFEHAQPVLAAMGKKAIHLGDAASAAQVKLIGNMLIAHMMQGLSEGAALASKAGIPLMKLIEVVQSSGYSSPYWEFKARPLDQRDFSTHFSVDLMHKDLSLALSTGWELGVPMPGTAAIREVYALAKAQGLGEKDFLATAAVVDPSLLK
jgi:3-hydroxyisobutyrate dehydrogenase